MNLAVKTLARDTGTGRRLGPMPVSFLFALAVNVSLFLALAFVNQRVQLDAQDVVVDPIEVYVRAELAEPPPELELELPEPEAPQAEPLEQLELAPMAAPLTPRMPIATLDAFDPFAMQIAVSDVDVEVVPVQSGPMDLPDVDRPPQRTKGRLPPYPLWAQSKGLEASLTVEFIVEVDGSVSNVRCTQLDGDPRFRQLAVEAVRQWRFKPASFRGESVPVRCFKKMRYRLQD